MNMPQNKNTSPWHVFEERDAVVFIRAMDETLNQDFEYAAIWPEGNGMSGYIHGALSLPDWLDAHDRFANLDEVYKACGWDSFKQFAFMDVKPEDEKHLPDGTPDIIGTESCVLDLMLIAETVAKYLALRQTGAQRFKTTQALERVSNLTGIEIEEIGTYHDGTNIPETTQEISIDTPMGTLVAYLNEDPIAPGIFIDLRRKNIDYALNLSGTEYQSQELSDPPVIKTHIWADAANEDTTHDVVHENIEKYFKTED